MRTIRPAPRESHLSFVQSSLRYFFGQEERKSNWPLERSIGGVASAAQLAKPMTWNGLEFKFVAYSSWELINLAAELAAARTKRVFSLQLTCQQSAGLISK